MKKRWIYTIAAGLLAFGLSGCSRSLSGDFLTLHDAIERNNAWRSWTMDTKLVENEQVKTTIREQDAIKEDTVYMIETYDSNEETLTRVEKTGKKTQDIFIVEPVDGRDIVTYYVQADVLKQYDAARSPIKEDLSLLSDKYFDSSRENKGEKTVLTFTLKKEMAGDYSKKTKSKQQIVSDVYEFVLDESKAVSGIVDEKTYANDVVVKKEVKCTKIGDTGIDFSLIDTTIGKFESPFDLKTLDPAVAQDLPVYTFEWKKEGD